ncbi:hypothetical protein BRD02_04820 [Halobacteriales archaeon QS_8_69_73]|nr:MAG: hypothetical protein BRD02_04820 [Halobacteriales archaeon QS_8_69_73]
MIRRIRSILTTAIWIVSRALDLFDEWTSSLDDGISRLVVRLVDPLLFSDDNVKIHHIREEVVISEVSPAVRFVWINVLTVWIVGAASGYEISTTVYPQIISGSGGIILAAAAIMRSRSLIRDEVIKSEPERVRFPVNRIRRKEYLAVQPVIAAFGATILSVGFVLNIMVITMPVLFEVSTLLTVERADALLAIAIFITVLGADLRGVFTGYVTWVMIALLVVSALMFPVNLLVGPGWVLALLIAQLVVLILVSLSILGRALYGMLSDLVGVLSSKSLYES